MLLSYALSLYHTSGQNPEWKKVDVNYKGEECVLHKPILDNEGNILFGSSSCGLVKYDYKNFIFYDSTNSCIPVNSVIPILVDNNNDIWLKLVKFIYDTNGIYKGNIYLGVMKTDLKNCTLYDSSNCALFGNEIECAALDSNGACWFSVKAPSKYKWGLMKYEDGVWSEFVYPSSFLPRNTVVTCMSVAPNNTIYFGSVLGLAKMTFGKCEIIDNKNLLSKSIKSMELDLNEELWISNLYGIVHYDGENWIKYDTSTHKELPAVDQSTYNEIAVDSANNIWSNSPNYYELIKINDDEISFLNENNSPLKDVFIRHFGVDKFNNLWITTCDGLFVYQEGGIILNSEDFKKRQSKTIAYPNPLSERTRIKFTLEKPSRAKLTVYDAFGRKVADLLDERLEAGERSVAFEPRGLPSGIYYCVLRAGERSETAKLVVVK